MYLSLWNNFTLNFKYAWKPQLIHFLSVAVLSGLFALYVPHQISGVTKFVRSNMVPNRYELSIPYSEINRPQLIQKKSLVIDLYLLYKNLEKNEVIYLLDKTECKKEKLEKRLSNYLMMFAQDDRKILTVRLFVDENIPMHFVCELRETLFMAGIYKLYYVVRTTENYCDEPALGSYGIMRRNGPPIDLDSETDKYRTRVNVPLPPPMIGNYFNKLDQDDLLLIIHVAAEDRFEINSKPGTFDQLIDHLKKYWKDGLQIMLVTDGNLKYGDYIKVSSLLQNFTLAQRNTYSMKHYNKKFFELYDRDQYQNVQKAVPFYSDYSIEEFEILKGME